MTQILATQQVYGQRSLSITDTAKVRGNVIRYDTLVRNKLSKTDNTKDDLNNSLKKVTDRFNRKADSLRNLHLPSAAYAQELDRAYHNFRDSVQRFRQRRDSLGLPKDLRLEKIDSVISTKTNALDSLMKSSGANLKYEELSARFDPTISSPSMPDINIPSIPVDKGLGIPSLNAPAIPNASTDVTANLPGLDKLNTPVLPDASTDVLEKLPDDLEKLNELKDKTEEIKGITDESEKLRDVDVMKEAEKRSEKEIMRVGEMDELKRGENGMAVMKDQTDALKDINADPNAAKAAAKEKFVDHFAGKKELVQKNLQEIGRIQLKYRTFADSRFLPKRPPNEMKGKPFVERLIPGITFQVFTHENVSVDVAPFVGYQFSGRIKAGIGGYRRLAYLKDSDRLKAVNCFGVRTFGSFKVIQNFNAYAEAEYFKNNVSSRYGWHQSERDRSHHWKLNLGIQKRYSMGKSFFGHFIVMYDLVKIKRFPNTEGASVRFGFDYQIKRKKKKEEVKEKS